MKKLTRSEIAAEINKLLDIYDTYKGTDIEKERLANVLRENGYELINIGTWKEGINYCGVEILKDEKMYLVYHFGQFVKNNKIFYTAFVKEIDS